MVLKKDENDKIKDLIELFEEALRQLANANKESQELNRVRDMVDDLRINLIGTIDGRVALVKEAIEKRVDEIGTYLRQEIDNALQPYRHEKERIDQLRNIDRENFDTICALNRKRLEDRLQHIDDVLKILNDAQKEREADVKAEKEKTRDFKANLKLAVITGALSLLMLFLFLCLISYLDHKFKWNLLQWFNWVS